MNCLIRKATRNDVEFIAIRIYDALGFDNPSGEIFDMFVDVCKREDVLYSWTNTLVAEVNTIPVGIITSYLGDNYIKMKTITFNLLERHGGWDYADMDLEAYPGEYYIDSLSVCPQYRKQGVGAALINAAIDSAKLCGAKIVTLACHPHNDNAYKFYTSSGFEYESDLFIFGENYWKMVKNI